MRPLTYRQAARCEDATGSRCRCRCGGAAHGAKRQTKAADGTCRAFLEALPATDPHHVPARKGKP